MVYTAIHYTRKEEPTNWPLRFNFVHGLPGIYFALICSHENLVRPISLDGTVSTEPEVHYYFFFLGFLFKDSSILFQNFL